jgi:hypothetical protein
VLGTEKQQENGMDRLNFYFVGACLMGTLMFVPDPERIPSLLTLIGFVLAEIAHGISLLEKKPSSAQHSTINH